jgi:putative ABC transport system ATP-binding protein
VNLRKGQVLASLRGITKEYTQGENSTMVLKGIDLDIQAGDFVSIMGSSGAGKSTLLHILGLLDHPSTGVYSLGDQNTADLDDNELSRLRGQAIGFVFQSFFLLSDLTALENILLPSTYSMKPATELRERALYLLDMVGLAEKARYTPARLSGGQQQRIAIARALLNAPYFLLADEPTGQLDAATSESIMELFRLLHRNDSTIIVVTHDPLIASAAKRQIHLHDGRVERDEYA